MTNPLEARPTPAKLPWVAGVLTLCCPGLGHLYVGRLTRGLLLFLVSLILIPAAALVAGIASSTAALAGLIGAAVVLLIVWCVAVVDACRIARRGEFEQHEYQKPLVYVLFLAAGICSPMLSAAYVRRSVLEAFYLPTKSMAPTLQEGDRILVNKTSRRLEHLGRGDVVVFRAPERRHLNFIKRIIGLPGDEVSFENGQLRINGAPVVMPGGPATSEKGSQDKPAGGPDDPAIENGQPGKQTVPPGTCFVVGDNLNNSLDSRKFGPVPLGDIIGVAEYIYLPGSDWGRFGTLQ